MGGRGQLADLRGVCWLCCMALSVSEVYYLSGETLCQVCLEHGLDYGGPVRLLRQRLADHIRSGLMDPPEIGQASPTTGLTNNTGVTIPPSVPSGSHGGGGEGAVPVLDLLCAVPPLCSEEPELIMGLLGWTRYTTWDWLMTGRLLLRSCP